jgi:hypothetical protein
LAEELLEGKFILERIFKASYQDAYGKQYEKYLCCKVDSYIEDDTGQVYVYETFEYLSKEESFTRPMN